MNFRLVINILGWALLLEAILLVLPLVCALFYGEQIMNIFAVCSLLCAAVGCLFLAVKPKNKRMYAKEGLATVSLCWVVMSLFGALPFNLSGIIPNYIDALFETVSGFTTTGATILTDVEVLPKSFLFWRSFTHWIGGMGVLMFLVSILKLSGGNNLYLMKAESTGPAVGKIVPRIQSTAKILYGIYTGLTLLQIILLLIGDMGFYEAIVISMGTAGTGGFGIKNSSLADYSTYSQIVVTVFMFIYGVDFSVYYLILIKKFKSAFKSEEVRWYFALVVISTVLIWINISTSVDNVFEALKHSVFQVTSIMTTTGYTTANFDLWPQFSKTILVILMFVGACAGSTGGGMKVSRVVIMFKTIIKELKTTSHPKSTHKITLSGHVIKHETLRSINVYMMAYFFIFVVSFLLVSLDNFDFTSNFTAIVATINNIGPGLSMVGPVGNFSEYSDLSTIIFILDMLVGRLEVFPMIMLFSPYAWKRQ